MKPHERYSPDDPREWLNRARSSLAIAKSHVTRAYLEDLANPSRRRPSWGTNTVRRNRALPRNGGTRGRAPVPRGHRDSGVRCPLGPRSALIQINPTAHFVMSRLTYSLTSPSTTPTWLRISCNTARKEPSSSSLVMLSLCSTADTNSASEFTNSQLPMRAVIRAVVSHLLDLMIVDTPSSSDVVTHAIVSSYRSYTSGPYHLL